MHLQNKSEKRNMIISITWVSGCVYLDTLSKSKHSDFMVNTTAAALEAF